MKRIFPSLAATLVAAFVLFVGSASAQTTTETFENLLPDMGSPDMEKQQKAQQEWQKICLAAGAPGKAEQLAEVNRLMCEQLDKDVPLDAKYWFLHQLQWTGDASVVPAIAKLLDDKDLRIRDRAARVLAQNPSNEAKTALQTALKTADGVRARVISDALASRAPDLKIGVESEPTQDLPYVSEGDFDKWMKGYGTLDLQGKVRTLAAVKVRKAVKYRPLALEALKSTEGPLKDAGLFALEKIATVEDVPVLLELLYTYDRGKVEWVMTGIAVDGFDEALCVALSEEKDNGRFEALAHLLARRSFREARGVILNRAGAEGVGNRVQLLSAAEPLASQGDIAAFAKVALMLPPSRERDQADQIVARLCKGDATPVVGLMNEQNATNVLPMLGRIGGDAALKTVKEYSAENPTHDVAVRALCNWPNAVVAKDLLAIAENASETEPNRIAALRAFARVISLPDDQIGISISAGDKVEMLRKAMGMATRIDEKQLIVDRSKAVRDPESVRFVMEYIDDGELCETVCKTVVEIAHHNNVRRPHKEYFGPVLDKVIEKVKDDGFRDRAKRYRNDM